MLSHLKRIDFEIEPSVIFVSPNKGLISEKTIPGGEGGLAKDHTFYQFVFLNPSLK